MAIHVLQFSFIVCHIMHRRKISFIVCYESVAKEKMHKKLLYNVSLQIFDGMNSDIHFTIVISNNISFTQSAKH